jgi:Bacterial protein of unknown function (DUF899)
MKPIRRQAPPKARRGGDAMTDHDVGTGEERMGWKFPWVSSYESDFPFDFGFAFTEEQMAGIDEVQQMIAEPPDWLQE